MNNNPVKHEIALINGVATRISSAMSTEENICIVVIPGNPGGIGFYDIFISTIFQAGKGKYSVYGVSHAGRSQTTIYKQCYNENDAWKALGKSNKRECFDRSQWFCL